MPDPISNAIHVATAGLEWNERACRRQPVGCERQRAATPRTTSPRLPVRGLIAALALFTTTLPAADLSKWTTDLASPDRDTRREASYQLLHLGAAAKPALPDLIKALDDADKQVWSNAIATIAALGPEAVDAVPKLLEGL